jgi:Tol biopolymer transport system component
VKQTGVELRLVRADGSKLRTLYFNPEFSYLEPAGFSPDGKEILTVLNAANEADKIALISVEDGGIRFLKTLPWGSLGRMSLSPDGRYVAYDFRPQQGKPGTNIMLLARDGSRELTLSESAVKEQLFGWAPDAKTLLFASERTGTRDLWALTLIDGKVQGDARRLRRGVGGMRPMGITRSGSLFYAEGTSTNEVFTASWDWQTGKVLVAAKPAGHGLLGVNRDPAWSRDGKYIAYVSGDRAPGKITLVNLGQGDERQLSPKLSAIQRLTDWSPDGRSVLLMALDEKNREGAYSVDVQTGDVRALAQAESGQTIFQPEWLPDGKAIVYYRRDQTSPPSHVIVHEIETGAERELHTGEADAGYIDTAMSPDGRYLAFRGGGGSYKGALGVVPVTGGMTRELFRPDAPAGRVDLVGWSPDSHQVIFDTKQRLGLRDVNRELWIIPADGGERRKLASDQLQADKIRFHPDGRRITYSAVQSGGMDGIWALENFLPKTVAK